MPLTLEDEARIELAIGRIGNTSFDMHYQIFKKSGADWLQSTKGKSAIVCFDYQKRTPMPIPEDWKAVLGR